MVVTVQKMKKKKKTDVCKFKKMSRERIDPHYGFNSFEKVKTALNYSHHRFN